MKKALIILLIFNFPFSILNSLHAADNSSEQLLRAQLADSAYRIADYEQAASLYEEVLASGFDSPDLYYNLGNTYYRLDRFGLAILNYERALRLKPSMSDAKENLAIANSKTQDRITELPRLFIVRWVDSLCTSVTPHAWRIVWLVLIVLLGVAILLLRWGSNTELRKAGLVGSIVTAVILVATTLLLIGSTKRYNAHDQAIVMEQAIIVKSSPEQQSVDKMLLHEGTKVDVLEELSGWYKIRIADGTTGWCSSTSIERI
jgi:tetratricopeptide (TPR) repeat protein